MFGMPLSPTLLLGSGKYIVYDGDLEVKPLAKLRFQVLFRVACSVPPAPLLFGSMLSSTASCSSGIHNSNATQPSFLTHIHLFLLFLSYYIQVEEFVTLIVNNWVPKDDEYAKNLKVGWGGMGWDGGWCTKLNAVLFRVYFFHA